jgi:hypothetical protein
MLSTEVMGRVVVTGMGAVEMGGDEKIWRTKMNKKTKLTNN